MESLSSSESIRPRLLSHDEEEEIVAAVRKWVGMTVNFFRKNVLFKAFFITMNFRINLNKILHKAKIARIIS